MRYNIEKVKYIYKMTEYMKWANPKIESKKYRIWGKRIWEHNAHFM